MVIETRFGFDETVFLQEHGLCKIVCIQILAGYTEEDSLETTIVYSLQTIRGDTSYDVGRFEEKDLVKRNMKK